MGLRFGFVLKTVLVDNTGMFLLLLSSAYTQSRSCLLLTPPHQWVGWGCTRSWEGTQPGQLTPTDQRDIPYHMTSCSAYKARGRRRKWGMFGVMVFVFTGNHYTWWSPAFLEVAEHLPADGKRRMNSLLCLCVQLLLYLNCLYLNLWVFSLLLFQFSPPSHWGWVSERLCGTFSCQLGLNHDK